MKNQLKSLTLLTLASTLDLLRLVSYNCRGWNSGVLFLKNSVTAFDLCLIQEHWLLHNQLSLLNFDFCSCGVSGMNDSVLLKGRPFGGYGIIF